MADEKRSHGVGFVWIFTLLFVTLKLVGEHFHTPVADWSWWLVLSPLWIGPLVILAIAACIGTVALVVAFFSD